MGWGHCSCRRDYYFMAFLGTENLMHIAQCSVLTSTGLQNGYGQPKVESSRSLPGQDLSEIFILKLLHQSLQEVSSFSNVPVAPST